MPSTPLSPQVRRNLVATDAMDSSLLANRQLGHLRELQYDWVDGALDASGAADELRDPLRDTGDGVFALIPPVDQVPMTRLFDTFVPRLGDTLFEHNKQSPDAPVRLRVAIHSGAVHYDSRGCCYGEDLNIMFRLLNAPKLKRIFTETDESLVLVVSDHVYQTVISQNYPGINSRDFEQLVRVRVRHRWHKGWVLRASGKLAGPADAVGEAWGEAAEGGVDLAG
jgi:hypothetical protein